MGRHRTGYHYCPSELEYRAKNPAVGFRIPKELKAEIEEVAKKNGGTVGGWCRLLILNAFDMDYQKKAEEEFAEGFKEKLIAEGGMAAIKSELLKKSITKEICPKKGCGGRILRLSYPTQNQTDNKIEIIIVAVGICDKCLTLKKL